MGQKVNIDLFKYWNRDLPLRGNLSSYMFG